MRNDRRQLRARKKLPVATVSTPRSSHAILSRQVPDTASDERYPTNSLQQLHPCTQASRTCIDIADPVKNGSVIIALRNSRKEQARAIMRPSNDQEQVFLN